MQSWTKRKIFQAIGVFALVCIGAVHAQEPWPSKPLNFVVGYPPGGGSDTMGRIVASKMSVLLGKNIVVYNRPGSAGQIAAAYVARSPADGYTLLIDASSFAINLGLDFKLEYTAQSFAPVGLLALFPVVVVSYPGFAARNIADVISLAKAKPGTILFASAGNGTVQHIFGAMLMHAANIELTHVPYKGASPAMTDVMGGQVQLFFANAASALPYVQSGRLRALAVTGGRRLAELPGVPTMAETSVGDVDLREWNGLYAPAATPTAILDRLSEALRRSMEDREVRERVAALSGTPFTGSRVEAAQFMDGEVRRMSRIIRELGIKAE
jgi:tripartite-type tricarboxylate transporter receptor subunit TctC